MLKNSLLLEEWRMRTHFNSFILPLDVICDMLKFDDACEMAPQHSHHYSTYSVTKIIISKPEKLKLAKHKLYEIYQNQCERYFRDPRNNQRSFI